MMTKGTLSQSPGHQDRASVAPTDRQLLERFVTACDESAFALLVEISRCLGVRPAAVFERAQQIAERESEA